VKELLLEEGHSLFIDLPLVVLQMLPLAPLNRLAPRLRRSVEGLNLELEEVFVSEKPDDQHEVRPQSDTSNHRGFRLGHYQVPFCFNNNVITF